MNKKTIIYCGDFKLPDRNAAAQRVLSNAKVFRELGYNVVFLDVDVETKGKQFSLYRQDNISGFERWSVPMAATSFESLMTIIRYKYVIDVIKNYPDTFMVVLYNHSALPMLHINRYCKNHGIVCVADITEWYTTKHRSFVYKITKGLDTALRMKHIHFKLDGAIVISRPLNEYYSGRLKTLYLPPLVDVNEEKWKLPEKQTHSGTKFVYAGIPSAVKERLDTIIDSICHLSKKYDVSLDVVGLSEQLYREMYSKADAEIGSCIHFHGKLEHVETLALIRQADYSLIIRDDNIVTHYGFPTKFSESITCGTPVIVTSSSNICDYVGNGINGYIAHADKFESELEEIINASQHMLTDSDVFDYRYYIKDTEEFIDSIKDV